MSSYGPMAGDADDYMCNQYFFQGHFGPNPIHAVSYPMVGQPNDFYGGWTPNNAAYVPTAANFHGGLSSSSGVTMKSDRVAINHFHPHWIEHHHASVTHHRVDLYEATVDERNYTCLTCHKRYCRKSTLKAHLKQHLDYKPFPCEVCGKSFSQAANLTAHRRVHTGEKPFSCSICFRPFSQSSSLVTHKRTHTGERPYPCAHCDKAFTDSSTLTKHLRTHTGQKPYQCYLCLMRFTQSGNLHRHMRTHQIQR